MGILGLGIFMTYRILNFRYDTEGSFQAVLLCDSDHPWGVARLSDLFRSIGWDVCGCVTGLLIQRQNSRDFSWNLGDVFIELGHAVCDALTQPLFIKPTENSRFFTRMNLPNYYDTVIIGLIMVLLIGGVLVYFFHTNLGQAYIATGDNEHMAKSMGINTDRMKIIGLIVSNGVIALSGALIAQNDGYADISKGIGVIVIGLASIIIGEVLYGN